MSATLDIQSSIRAYADSAATGNPLRRFVDWTKKLAGIKVDRPFSRQYSVDPSATITVFSGQRTTTIDGTTRFTTTVSPLSNSRFRITNVSGNTAGFRTDKVPTIGAQTLTITVNNNALESWSLAVGSTFGTAVVGDIVFVPGTSTGDVAGLFNALNEGFWQIIQVTDNKNIQVARLAGQAFSGVSEAVALAANANAFMVFSAAGVQPTDMVEISVGFSTPALGSYSVDKVTKTWFEIVTTKAFPLDVSVAPTATGMVFYTDPKRLVRVECDQEAAVQFNGDTGQLVRVSPIAPADPDNVGYIEKWGTTWQLAVVNRSVTQMTVNIIAAN